MKQNLNDQAELEQQFVGEDSSGHLQVLADVMANDFGGSLAQSMICPNCGARLEGRKCKLFCLRAGCGYLVTCSEW